MLKLKQKPPEPPAVLAVKWDGENRDEISEFLNGAAMVTDTHLVDRTDLPLRIDFPHGEMLIIRKDHYLVKLDAFNYTVITEEQLKAHFEELKD